MDLGNISVSVVGTLGVIGGLVKWAAPAWVQQQIADSKALAELGERVTNAERIHADLKVVASKLDDVVGRVDRQTTALERIGETLTEAMVTLAKVQAVQEQPPARRRTR